MVSSARADRRVTGAGGHEKMMRERLQSYGVSSKLYYFDIPLHMCAEIDQTFVTRSVSSCSFLLIL
jgi:hypothetical protein